MNITRVHIEGFRRFSNYDIELNRTFNIIVGDNETGKSTLLEAMGVVLTGQYDGRLLQYSLDPYLFNVEIAADYFHKLRNGETAAPPKIEIEAYFQDDPSLARLKGTNNTRSENCPGLVVAIEVDGNHAEALVDYASDSSNPAVLPVEFYRATWRSFDGNGVYLRNLPFRAAKIDTSIARIYRGPYKYLSQVADDVLNEEQRRQLSLAYKKMRHGFSQEPGVTAINKHLEKQGSPSTTKKLTIQMDMSARASWESAISAHLDDLPFDCAGKGEQSRVQMRLAIAGADKAQVLLIEEPENHLSHSNLNMFMDDIRTDCADRQVIVTTHSAFVLNKLGIDNLRLVSASSKTGGLGELKPATKNYFMKLPGYNTLRLILSKRSILVEGPSDELVVQRAYQNMFGKLPLEDGVDVISVGSLAFKRFLEIAVLLNLNVRVVTDNDRKLSALKKKYADYLSGSHSNIGICFDEDISHPNLESQLLKANSLSTLNKILGKSYKDNDSLLKYMDGNKTDCALKLFETDEVWTAPEYINSAIQK